MNEQDKIEYREKLFKQYGASKLFEEIFNGLRKEFGEKLFTSAHHLLYRMLENFSQNNKKNKLIATIISKQGELSALGHFVVENELILSDEVIRRLKEMFQKIYINLFCLLEKMLEEEENKER